MNTLSDLEQFILSRWCYSLGEPIISNEEYSRLYHLISVTSPDSPYMHRTWSDDPCPIDLLKKIGREDLIQNVTLGDATESIPSLNTFHELENELKYFNEDATLSMKHDGWNIQFNYYNGHILNVHTRGRTGGNLKVDRLIRLAPPTIPYMGRVKVVQELTIPMLRWKEIRNKFGNANPRNAVHTLLAKDDTDEYLQLHAVDVHGIDMTGKCKFDVLRDMGFDIPLFHHVHNYTELLLTMKEMSLNKATYCAPTDGLVFDSSIHWAIRLLAWEEPIYVSFVTGYFEKYSAYHINPSILIHPVLCSGRNQRQVNITNWGRIIENELKVGSPIAFRNASDAIADIDEKVTKMLQTEWNGRWDEWKRKIVEDEEIKKIQMETIGSIML